MGPGLSVERVIFKITQQGQLSVVQFIHNVPVF